MTLLASLLFVAIGASNLWAQEPKTWMRIPFGLAASDSIHNHTGAFVAVEARVGVSTFKPTRNSSPTALPRGRVEWKFTRKNHLYFEAIPLGRTKEAVLTRTVVFEGQTFTTGLTAEARFEN